MEGIIIVNKPQDWTSFDVVAKIRNLTKIKKNIGYLPENNPLYNDMPVIDYLYFVAELHDIPKTRTKDKILEMVNPKSMIKR